jgi:hypothetical protein
MGLSWDQISIERYVRDQGCEWKFNPPHASHFGGVWEHQIGTICRVLNAMLLGKVHLLCQGGDEDVRGGGGTEIFSGIK